MPLSRIAGLFCLYVISAFVFSIGFFSIAYAAGDAADKQCIPFEIRCPCGQKYNPEHDKDSKQPKCIKGENKHLCACTDTTAGDTAVNGICYSEGVCTGELCDGSKCKKTEPGQVNGSPETPTAETKPTTDVGGAQPTPPAQQYDALGNPINGGESLNPTPNPGASNPPPPPPPSPDSKSIFDQALQNYQNTGATGLESGPQQGTPADGVNKYFNGGFGNNIGEMTPPAGSNPSGQYLNSDGTPNTNYYSGETSASGFNSPTTPATETKSDSWWSATKDWVGANVVEPVKNAFSSFDSGTVAPIPTTPDTNSSFNGLEGTDAVGTGESALGDPSRPPLTPDFSKYTGDGTSAFSQPTVGDLEGAVDMIDATAQKNIAENAALDAAEKVTQTNGEQIQKDFELANAKDALNAAKASGDQNAIKAATEKYNTAVGNFNTAQGNYNDALKADAAAQQELADAKNNYKAAREDNGFYDYKDLTIEAESKTQADQVYAAYQKGQEDIKGYQESIAKTNADIAAGKISNLDGESKIMAYQQRIDEITKNTDALKNGDYSRVEEIAKAQNGADPFKANDARALSDALKPDWSGVVDKWKGGDYLGAAGEAVKDVGKGIASSVTGSYATALGAPENPYNMCDVCAQADQIKAVGETALNATIAKDIAVGVGKGAVSIGDAAGGLVKDGSWGTDALVAEYRAAAQSLDAEYAVAKLGGAPPEEVAAITERMTALESATPKSVIDAAQAADRAAFMSAVEDYRAASARIDSELSNAIKSDAPASDISAAMQKADAKYAALNGETPQEVINAAKAVDNKTVVTTEQQMAAITEHANAEAKFRAANDQAMFEANNKGTGAVLQGSPELKAAQQNLESAGVKSLGDGKYVVEETGQTVQMTRNPAAAGSEVAPKFTMSDGNADVLKSVSAESRPAAEGAVSDFEKITAEKNALKASGRELGEEAQVSLANREKDIVSRLERSGLTPAGDGSAVRAMTSEEIAAAEAKAASKAADATPSIKDIARQTGIDAIKANTPTLTKQISDGLVTMWTDAKFAVSDAINGTKSTLADIVASPKNFGNSVNNAVQAGAQLLAPTGVELAVAKPVSSIVQTVGSTDASLGRLTAAWTDTAAVTNAAKAAESGVQGAAEVAALTRGTNAYSATAPYSYLAMPSEVASTPAVNPGESYNPNTETSAPNTAANQPSTPSQNVFETGTTPVNQTPNNPAIANNTPSASNPSPTGGTPSAQNSNDAQPSAPAKVSPVPIPKDRPVEASAPTGPFQSAPVQKLQAPVNDFRAEAPSKPWSQWFAELKPSNPFISSAEAAPGVRPEVSGVSGTIKAADCMASEACLTPLTGPASRYQLNNVGLNGGTNTASGYIPGSQDMMIASQSFPLGTFGQLCNGSSCIYAFVGDTGNFNQALYSNTKFDMLPQVYNNPKLGDTGKGSRIPMTYSPIGIAPNSATAAQITRNLNAGQKLEDAVKDKQMLAYASGVPVNSAMESAIRPAPSQLVQASASVPAAGQIPSQKFLEQLKSVVPSEVFSNIAGVSPLKTGYEMFDSTGKSLGVVVTAGKTPTYQTPQQVGGSPSGNSLISAIKNLFSPTAQSSPVTATVPVSQRVVISPETTPPTSPGDALARADNIVIAAKQAIPNITNKEIAAQIAFNGLQNTPTFNNYRAQAGFDIFGTRNLKPEQIRAVNGYIAQQVAELQKPAGYPNVAVGAQGHPIVSYPASANSPGAYNTVNNFLWDKIYNSPNAYARIDSGGDFTWKDIAAALNSGRSVRDEVLNMNTELKVALYGALRQMIAEGLQPSGLAFYRDAVNRPAATGQVVASPENSQHFNGGVANAADIGSAVIVPRPNNMTKEERDANDNARDVESRKIWDRLAQIGRQHNLRANFIANDPAHVQPAGNKTIFAQQLQQVAADAKFAAGNTATKPVATPDLPVTTEVKSASVPSTLTVNAPGLAENFAGSTGNVQVRFPNGYDPAAPIQPYVYFAGNDTNVASGFAAKSNQVNSQFSGIKNAAVITPDTGTTPSRGTLTADVLKPAFDAIAKATGVDVSKQSIGLIAYSGGSVPLKQLLSSGAADAQLAKSGSSITLLDVPNAQSFADFANKYQNASFGSYTSAGSDAGAYQASNKALANTLNAPQITNINQLGAIAPGKPVIITDARTGVHYTLPGDGMLAKILSAENAAKPTAVASVPVTPIQVPDGAKPLPSPGVTAPLPQARPAAFAWGDSEVQMAKQIRDAQLQIEQQAEAARQAAVQAKAQSDAATKALKDASAAFANARAIELAAEKGQLETEAKAAAIAAANAQVQAREAERQQLVAQAKAAADAQAKAKAAADAAAKAAKEASIANANAQVKALEAERQELAAQAKAAAEVQTKAQAAAEAAAKAVKDANAAAAQAQVRALETERQQLAAQTKAAKDAEAKAISDASIAFAKARNAELIAEQKQIAAEAKAAQASVVAVRLPAPRPAEAGPQGTGPAIATNASVVLSAGRPAVAVNPDKAIPMPPTVAQSGKAITKQILALAEKSAPATKPVTAAPAGTKTAVKLPVNARPVADLRSAKEIADEIAVMQKKVDELQAQSAEAQKLLPAAQARFGAANKISTNITSAEGKIANAQQGIKALRDAVASMGATDLQKTIMANGVAAARNLPGNLAEIPGGSNFVGKVQSYVAQADALTASPSASGASATAAAGDTLASEVSNFLKNARATNRPEVEAAQAEFLKLKTQSAAADGVIKQLQSLQTAKSAAEKADAQIALYEAEAQKAVAEARVRIDQIEREVNTPEFREMLVIKPELAVAPKPSVLVPASADVASVKTTGAAPSAVTGTPAPVSPTPSSPWQRVLAFFNLRSRVPGEADTSATPAAAPITTVTPPPPLPPPPPPTVLEKPVREITLADIPDEIGGFDVNMPRGATGEAEPVAATGERGGSAGSGATPPPPPTSAGSGALSTARTVALNTAKFMCGGASLRTALCVGAGIVAGAYLLPSPGDNAATAPAGAGTNTQPGNVPATQNGDMQPCPGQVLSDSLSASPCDSNTKPGQVPAPGPAVRPPQAPPAQQQVQPRPTAVAPTSNRRISNFSMYMMGNMLGQGLASLFGLGNNQQTTSQSSSSVTPVVPPPVTPPPPVPNASTTPPLAPVIALVANPSSVSRGGVSILSWASIGASACALRGPDNSVLASSTIGSKNTPPLASTTAFVVRCESSRGLVSVSTTSVFVR